MDPHQRPAVDLVAPCPEHPEAWAQNQTVVSRETASISPEESGGGDSGTCRSTQSRGHPPEDARSRGGFSRPTSEPPGCPRRCGPQFLPATMYDPEPRAAPAFADQSQAPRVAAVAIGAVSDPVGTNGNCAQRRRGSDETPTE